LEIVKLLLENGANVNTNEEKYGIALQAVCEGSDLEVVRFLLEKGGCDDLLTNSEN
jgi:ankyrin repeat protein